MRTSTCIVWWRTPRRPRALRDSNRHLAFGAVDLVAGIDDGVPLHADTGPDGVGAVAAARRRRVHPRVDRLHAVGRTRPAELAVVLRALLRRAEAAAEIEAAEVKGPTMLSAWTGAAPTASAAATTAGSASEHARAVGRIRVNLRFSSTKRFGNEMLTVISGGRWWSP